MIKRIRFSTSKLLLIHVLTLGLMSLCQSASAQNEDVNQPRFEKIAYRRTVPVAIRRKAKKIGPTRFFGTFRQGQNTYAVHFYNQSRVRVAHDSDSKFVGPSHLDVFQLANKNTWLPKHSFDLTRRVDDKSDPLRVEAYFGWLDPIQKTTPMIHLKATETNKEKWNDAGYRTDVYGVLLTKPNLKTFISFNTFVPYNPSLITSTEISFPDAKGRVTVLDISSEPEETGYTAYGWNGESWEVVARTNFPNTFEKARRWSGTEFVPLEDKKQP